jgi:hypothetical protein
MAESYCAASDLYSFGLPRGALANPARPVASVSAGGNTITLDLHGFALNDQVSFRAEASGTLPAPLVASTTYYAIPVSDSVFSVAAAADGAAIDLTTAGTRVVVISPLPVAEAIAWASRVIDDMLPAHLVPLEDPIAEIVTMTCAELAASKLLARQGSASVSLTSIADAARKRLERWAAGAPIRGENAPEPASLAASASASVPDTRGWNRFGGIG